MRRLVSFMVMTLDGYTEGPEHAFDWPNVDDEFNEFSVSQLNDIDILLFGRVTYEGMASFWPTPEAFEFDPVIAERMNTIPKVVLSSTLAEATWQNSTLVIEDAISAAAKLKQEDGKDLALFGSQTLTVSLLEAGLIDELRVLVNPILLSGGPTLFAGLHDRVPLTLMRTTVFCSGNVLLRYRPA